MSNSNGQANGTANGTAIVQAKPQGPLATFAGYLDSRKDQIAKVLPKHLSAERITKVAIACAMKTPALLKCKIESVYLAVHQAAQLGLEPGGPLGHAYLVPYGDTCTLIVGYKGLIDLARRSGMISSIESHVVYEKDKFSAKFGTGGAIVHEPYFDGDPGKPRLVYAFAKMKDGAEQWEVMTLSEIDAIKKRSKSSGSGPWVTDYTEMARKTVVRRLIKYLPTSTELADAIGVDDEADAPTSAWEAMPIDVNTGEVMTQSAQVRGRIPDAPIEGEIIAPRDEPADRTATLNEEADLLLRISESQIPADLAAVGNAIESAKKRIGKDAHARLIKAYQARNAQLS